MGKQRKGGGGGGGGARGKGSRKDPTKSNKKKELRAHADDESKRQACKDAVERILDESNLQNSLLIGRLYYFMPNFPDYDRSDVNSRRGILERIIDGDDQADDDADSSTATAVFIPIIPLDDSDQHRVVIPLKNVIRQLVPWTLRFEVGDAVVTYDAHTDMYVEATVEYLWPVWESPQAAFGKNRTESIVLYQCRTMDSARRVILVSEDADRSMQKLPTTFRFTPGDRVYVAIHRLFGYNNAAENMNIPVNWVPAVITDTHVLDQIRYATYECVFEGTTEPLYYIRADTDAYVTSAAHSPRDRLFAALQDPEFTRDDFSFLVKSHGIHIKTFDEQFRARVLENASYGGIGLLMVDEPNYWQLFKSLRNDLGDCVLYQMAGSPHVDRYLQPAARNVHIDWSVRVAMSEAKPAERFWVEPLVDNPAATLRTLEYALSPDLGLGHLVVMAYSSEADVDHVVHRLECIRETAWNRRRFELARMIDYLLLTFPVYGAYDDFSGKGRDRECHALLGRFTGGGRSVLVQWFAQVAFERRRTRTMDVGYLLFRSMEENGYEYIELVLEGIPGLANATFYQHNPGSDRNEFLEQSDGNELPKDFRTTRLIDAIAIYRSFSGIHRTPTAKARDEYYFQLMSYCSARKEKQISLHDFLRQTDTKDIASNLPQYRAALLEDEPLLEKRLRLLDILIKRYDVSPPTPLTTIRWRQRRVLRWLVDEGTIALNATAKSQHSLLEGSKHRFLGGRVIPSPMTVSEYLCFACVEYDDLLSLQWLVIEKGGEVLSLRCNGWGILHAAASFGRAEIILWLEELDGFDVAASVASTRKGEETKLPVHLALEGGHCFIADRLLDHHNDDSELFHQRLMQIVKKSSHSNVQEWGKKRQGPRKLGSDARTLLRLLQQEPPQLLKAETHILDSWCLDVGRWINSGMWLDKECYEEGPWRINKQYMDLLVECAECADRSLIKAMTLGCFRPNEEQHSRNDAIRHWIAVSGAGQSDSTEAPMANEKLRKEFQRMHDGSAFERLLSKSQNWTSDDDLRDVRDPALVDPILKCMFRLTRERKSTRALLAVSEIRDNILKIDFLAEVREKAKCELLLVISRGLSSSLVENVLESFQESSTRLALERRIGDPDLLPSIGLMSADGVFNASIANYWKYSSPNWRGMLLLDDEYKLPLYQFVAIEDYVHLAKWLLFRPTNLNSRQELEMVRVAVFFGSQRVVELLLSSSSNEVLQSKREARIHAAMIGAAELGNLSALEDFYAFAGNTMPREEIVSEVNTEFRPTSASDGATSDDSNYFQSWKAAENEAIRILSESISACAVNGYLLCALDRSADHEAVCRWLVANGRVSSSTLLLAAHQVLKREHKANKCVRLPSLLSFLKGELRLDVYESIKEIEGLTKLLVDRASSGGDWYRAYLVAYRKAAGEWMELLVLYGMDIQNYKYEVHNRELDNIMQEHRVQQLRSWAAFDIVKRGQALENIQSAVAKNQSLLTMRDRGGRPLTHVAAAYDRLDVVQWLVRDLGQDVSKLDNDGHDVEAIARACGCASIVTWIERYRAEETITLFLSRYIYRRRAIRLRDTLATAITKLQAWSRRISVAKTYRNRILSRLETSSKFKHVWSAALDALRCEGSPRDSVWVLLRERHADIVRNGEPESIQRLDEAVEAALGHDDEREGYDIDSFPDDKYKPYAEYLSLGSSPPHATDRVLLTADVLKWCRQGDSKYVGFFVRRMKQLASGERSRVLAKRLKGYYNTAVFETYLEQKSGYRILWTVQASGDVVVWFVVPHKKVSRFASLIDSSVGRSGRQLVDAVPMLGVGPSDDSSLTAPSDQIMLDPFANTPLKLYTVTSDRLPNLAKASWTPPLRLTAEERAIVEASGTSLVLGRSGTGKTVCLCNKIDFDRHIGCNEDSFSQLFVARSERLTRFVKRAVGDAKHCTFTTFQDLLSTLERSLSTASASLLFLPSQRVDFALFKRDVYRDKKQWGGVDALVVWTNIRSFMKGSIEALASPDRILSYEDYCSVEKLGKKRCRLSPELRPDVYRAFQTYRKYIEETGRWDDCDRISCLLQRLQVIKDEDPDGFESLRYSKIYVDEVQDYTQAEILLFFYLSRHGDLFLCGDPAQSVVEGVEFRFDEIRSVAHFIAGADRRHLVPHKPMTVNVNFRSHSGILNVAAAVLSRLFSVFPDSAKQLKEDRGLFVGPRPGVLYKADMHLLNNALASVLNGTTILVRDEHKLRCSQLVDEYRLLYGIREAKGLEFKSVIIFDFFSGISMQLQKAWRDLLLGRTTIDYAARFPEVEGQLKLLYTAITRSIDRLLFVESKPSVAGEAFCRWVTTTTTRTTFRSDEALAVRQRVSDVESLQMTVDEWVLTGLENAEAADDSTDAEVADSYLSKALHCFERANHGPFAAKARAHRASAQFRSRLERRVDDDDDLLLPESRKEKDDIVLVNGEDDLLEVEAARMLSRLFREGLWIEAAKVCQLVLPHLPEYTQEQLRRHVLPKLPILLK